VVFESEVKPSGSEGIPIVEKTHTLATRLPRFQQPYRTTFLFAIFIFAGGLFCVFYFFNGIEMLRPAAAGSHEFLYPRPTALVQNNNQAEASKQKTVPNSSPAESRDSGKPDSHRVANAFPFSRNIGSPNLPDSPAGSPNNPAGTSLPGIPALPDPGSPLGPGSAPNPGSLLGQLNLLPAGEDALSQVMNQVAAKIARVANLYANSSVNVIKAPVSRTTHKAAAQARAARRTAQSAIANVATRQNLKNSTRHALGVVSSTQSEISPLSWIEPPTTIIGGTVASRGRGGGGAFLGGSLGNRAGLSAGGRGAAGGMGGLGGLGGTVGGLLGGRH